MGNLMASQDPLCPPASASLSTSFSNLLHPLLNPNYILATMRRFMAAELWSDQLLAACHAHLDAWAQAHADAQAQAVQAGNTLLQGRQSGDLQAGDTHARDVQAQAGQAQVSRQPQTELCAPAASQPQQRTQSCTSTAYEDSGNAGSYQGGKDRPVESICGGHTDGSESENGTGSSGGDGQEGAGITREGEEGKGNEGCVSNDGDESDEGGGEDSCELPLPAPLLVSKLCDVLPQLWHYLAHHTADPPGRVHMFLQQ